MGTYASLTFGEFSVGDFRYGFLFHTLLLFTQEDLLIERIIEDDEEVAIYKFATTVRQAKYRMDARGITLGMCRQWFEENRPREVYRYDPNTKKGQYTKLALDFDQFLQGLSYRYRFDKDKSLSAIEYRMTGQVSFEDNPSPDFMSDFFLLYDQLEFDDDILLIIMWRSLLEVLPDDVPVILDFSALVYEEYIKEEEVNSLIDDYMQTVIKDMEFDYKVYRFVLEEDPSVKIKLRERITGLNEDQFITHVLQPLLERMGYERVRQVSFHGRNEFGSDILPFRYTNPIGSLEYYAVQAKATEIHGTSARQGNAAELVSQAIQAFSVSFVDDLDNERKRIDKFIIATNKNITVDARRFIEEAIEGKRRLIFLDIDRILELVKKYRLLQYILYSDLQ